MKTYGTAGTEVRALDDVTVSFESGAFSAIMGLVMIVAAAVVTGTNSFSIQVATTRKLAPSFEVLGQPGPYELASYVLAATAAYGIGRWQLVGRWPGSKAARLPSASVGGRQLAFGLAAAGLTLLGSQRIGRFAPFSFR